MKQIKYLLIQLALLLMPPLIFWIWFLCSSPHYTPDGHRTDSGLGVVILIFAWLVLMTLIRIVLLISHLYTKDDKWKADLAIFLLTGIPVLYWGIKDFF